LILIAEKATVYTKLPTPLINRLEKHFLLSETVLLGWQKEVLKNLIKWIDKFGEICTSDSKFTKQDAFIGYQCDTPASVIFKLLMKYNRKVNTLKVKSQKKYRGLY
uniref:Uncharacterized protein n=1 Tax=Amphimedon queenslandica TaxID=400682 RepID=A0A1X7TAT7_AMPQE